MGQRGALQPVWTRQWGEGESKVARGYFTRTAEPTTVLFPEVREAGRGLGRKRRSCSLALRL